MVSSYNQRRTNVFDISQTFIAKELNISYQVLRYHLNRLVRNKYLTYQGVHCRGVGMRHTTQIVLLDTFVDEFVLKKKCITPSYNNISYSSKPKKKKENKIKIPIRDIKVFNKENQLTKKIKDMEKNKNFKEASVKIYATTDYDMFSKVSMNRKVKNNKKLKESIEKYGFLPCYPIVVTSDFVITEGQHRLATVVQIMEERKAKDENAEPIEVFFVIDDTKEIPIEKKILIPNTNSRRDWDTEDWLNYYAEQNYPQYVLFKNLCCEELPFSGIGNRIVIFSHGKTSVQKFKDGKLEGDADFYKKIVADLKESGSKLNGRTPFIASIVDFYDNFIDKLSKDECKKFKDCLGQEDTEQVSREKYLRRFLNLAGIKNYKAQDKYFIKEK